MKKELRWIPNGEPEARFKAIDRVLTRFSRRLKSTVTGVITPIPISVYVSPIPEDGALIRYIFPMDGEVTKVCLFASDKVKEPLVISATIDDNDGSKSQAVKVLGQAFMADISMPVKTGDRLSVNAMSDERPNALWIAFTWVPLVRDSVVKRFLAEEFDNAEGTGTEAETEGGEEVSS